jgi:DNA polymerase I-like protein with 3'-5' exonuclease and polymerase domains
VQNKPTLIVIDSLSDTKAIGGYLADKDIVALDTETTGVHKGAQVVGYSFCAEEDVAFYVVLAKYNKDTKELEHLDTMNTAKEIFQILATKQLIGHNYIFDAQMIASNFQVETIEALHTDTMVLAHLLNENREVGLKPLAAAYFGDNSTDESKEMKASVLANGGVWQDNGEKEMYKADWEILGKYGAKDAWLTYKLFHELLPELVEQGLEDFFYVDESMPLLKGPTYQLNTTGLKVDTERLKALQKQLEAECAEAEHFIMTEIVPLIKAKYPGTTKKNTFNIGSSQQLAWLLFGELNQEFNILTDTGKEVCRHFELRLPYTRALQKAFIIACQKAEGQKYTPDAIINGKLKKGKKIKAPWAYIKCDKKALAKIAPKFKWVQELLEYQRKQKLISTYCIGILERVEYGIVHPSFLQHGTPGGRYASRNPNFQNLPRREKRIKECIVARPGKVFVGADESQLEPRIFAYYSQDPRLLKAFTGDDDFYSVIGMETFDKLDCTPSKEDVPESFKNKYPEVRDSTKVFALASVYGATANQLAPTLKKSIEDTEQAIENYFEKFPKVKDMMLSAYKGVKNNGYVTNLFGRRRRIPEALKIQQIYGNQSHSDLPYKVRSLLNLAVNFPIQSTGASIVNRASILFNNSAKLAGIKCAIVCQVHDSLIVECDEADGPDVAALLQHAMETAVQLPGINFEAIPKIGKNFAEV